MNDDFDAITATDSYKFGGHWNMLRSGTENAYAYGEARVGGEYPNLVWYGLQGILLKYLVGAVVTQENLEEAKEISLYHLGSESYLNIEGWQTIIDEFGGKLPIEIYAAPEGEIIPEGNILFSIQATDERFAWLTNYHEGVLMKSYYPSVIASRSKETVDIVKHYFEISSDLPLDVAKFLVHDFGYRACASEDAAQIGCSAHLINSLGTDTVPALKYLKKYYKGDYKTLGYSCAATEHNIASAYGTDERQYLLDLMEKYPDGILSVVGDTNKITDFANVVVRGLKSEIIARHENGKAPINRVVIRPDSPRFKGDTPDEQILWIYETLADIFGTTINSKGFKVLHPAIGEIYGDSLTTKQIKDSYRVLVENGYSVENCVVGQGGGLVMRDIDRDTCRFAIKGSAHKVNGEWHDVYKNPMDQTKASKKGRLKLVKMQKTLDPADGWEYKTINEHHPLYHDMKDELVLVYRNGEMVTQWAFDEVKERANKV